MYSGILLRSVGKSNVEAWMGTHMSYSLNSFKGGYIGDYRGDSRGDYYRGY